MEFLLLGPVELRVDDRAVPLGGTKQRAIAAMLAVHVNEVVSRDRLIDGLWGDAPPPSAAHTVESYVSRIRKILREAGRTEVLATRTPGYQLTLPPDAVDVHRFQRLVREARRATADGDPAHAARLFREALTLFRGPPLDDVGFLPFATPLQAQLTEEQLTVTEDRLDADLATGRAAELIGELHALVDAHPLRERTRSQLMLALYREGRQSDALAVYRQGRALLTEELGVEPGVDLQRLEWAILRHDESLDLLGGPLAARAKAPTVARSSSPAGERTVAPDPSGPPPGTTPPPQHPQSVSVRRRLLAGSAAVLVITGGLVVARVWANRSAAGSSGITRVAASSLGIVDPTTGRLTGQVVLHDQPGAVSAGDRAVWVADPSGHTLAKVDADDRQVVDTVPLTGTPSALVVGDGAVWVAEQGSGDVQRVSTQTDTVVQTIPVGRGPSAIDYAGGQVWIAVADDRDVVELDAGSGNVVRRTHLAVRPTDIAVGDGAVWVSSADAGAVYRIGQGGNDVTRIGVGTSPGPLLVGPDGVWVANTLDGTVSRISPTTGVVTATVVTGSDPTSLVAADGVVWVSDTSAGTVVAIDPGTATVIRQVRTDSPPEALAATDGAVWVTTGRSVAAHRGGTLHVVAAFPRLDSIDPGLAFLLFPPQLLGMTNDGLVTLRHVSGSAGTQVVPDLATTVPEPTDHGRSYRFRLRSGVDYSTGVPVRPLDFRRALDRDFKIGSPGTSFFTDVVGARACQTHPRECNLAKGVTIDRAARSVTFHLTHADADFLSKLTLTFADAIPPGTPDHDVGRHPVPATGPYRITRYVPGHRLVLGRSPTFHQWSAAAQPDGYPDHIVWRFGLTPNAAVDAVEHGRADWALYPFPFSPPGDRLDELRTRYPGQVHANPLPETEFFTLDTRVAPFDDVRVRRALNDAVDRNAVARLYGGRQLATPTCQVLPPGIPGYRRWCPYSRGTARGPYAGPRLAQARHLVAESGTRGMRVRVISDPHFPPAHYVASVLRELGYRASVRAASGSRIDVLESNSRYRSQVDQGGWAADYPSAAEFLDYFLSCQSFRPDSDTNKNAAEFCSHRVDTTIARAERLQLRRPVAAGRAWSTADKRVTDLAPWLPTVNLQAVDFVSHRVGGYEFHPQWGILLDQLWVR
jgi:DNA-binding SARP family transcriptional activator/ABC-type transport system substrate-binding protein